MRSLLMQRMNQSIDHQSKICNAGVLEEPCCEPLDCELSSELWDGLQIPVTLNRLRWAWKLLDGSWYCIIPTLHSWSRWYIVVATWRSVSTAWTCLHLMAATRILGWWQLVTPYHPVLSLRLNCTPICSCSEPAWTWSSSSWTHGKLFFVC